MGPGLVCHPHHGSAAMGKKHAAWPVWPTGWHAPSIVACCLACVAHCWHAPSIVACCLACAVHWLACPLKCACRFCTPGLHVGPAAALQPRCVLAHCPGQKGDPSEGPGQAGQGENVQVRHAYCTHTQLHVHLHIICMHVFASALMKEYVRVHCFVGMKIRDGGWSRRSLWSRWYL